MKKLLKTLAPRWLISRYEKELRKETHINRTLAKNTGPTTYVEIGVRDGACIHQIRADRKIAIDPAPVDPQHIREDGTEMFEVPSDETIDEIKALTYSTLERDRKRILRLRHPLLSRFS